MPFPSSALRSLLRLLPAPFVKSSAPIMNNSSIRPCRLMYSSDMRGLQRRASCDSSVYRSFDWGWTSPLEVVCGTVQRQYKYLKMRYYQVFFLLSLLTVSTLVSGKAIRYERTRGQKYEPDRVFQGWNLGSAMKRVLSLRIPNLGMRERDCEVNADVMIPVSSTVIPLDELPVYKVGFGFNFNPSEFDKPEKNSKKAAELLTAKKKKLAKKDKAKVHEVTQEEFEKLG
ncbi:unnamed protein product [Darwinula stevensoni]|uniref:Uncharacterized protein n=1 Tax=Darwinula stevensoni TaxID=69355 RepID=A0A7R8X8T3_9CRUS|nr:unnamed protein product [Darwinula stevensoni]CAG0889987.1 unnamed protein product [Darwinula stevensoni]